VCAHEVGNENMVMLMKRTRSVVWKYSSKMREKEANFSQARFSFSWEAGGVPHGICVNITYNYSVMNKSCNKGAELEIQF